MICIATWPRPTSTNCGRKAKKNSAVFGLSRFTTNPSRNSRAWLYCGSSPFAPAASAGPKIFRRPSQIRYAAPAYFTMLKASAEESSRTDKPSAAASTWMKVAA